MENGAAARQAKLGLTLVMLSTVLFGLSGIFTKIITADAWTILTWRGLFGAAIIGVYLYFKRRGEHKSFSEYLGWRGWLLAAVGSLSSIAFIGASWVPRLCLWQLLSIPIGKQRLP